MSGDWWRNSVIYQIYPRSFADSNGDGVGDLRGIVERLDYVAALGVDGIWLSPFFVSPMADFGYDVADYRDVDPLFGTLAEFDALLEIARFWLERGVDGFRLDAVDFLVHDPALRDNPAAAASGARNPLKPYHMQQHLHDTGGAEVLPVIERIRALTDRYPGAVTVAEVGSETTDISSLARAAGYIGDGQ